MSHPKLTPERLLRTATVYVRQSTPTQVTHHMESHAANTLWRIEPASLAFNESPSSTKIWGAQGQD